MGEAGVGLEHDALHAAARGDDLRAAIGALRMRGDRVTAPRRAVLTVLAARADHLTADEVASLLGEGDVHRATVYRTLDLLAASGVVSRQHAPGGAARYHLATTAAGRRHLHGQCVDCGAVVVLPPEALRTASRMLRAMVGFTLALDQSTLVGRCAACAATPHH
ncbi:Fur family transcriptional regulator [Microbacterium jiangjiandongii]|uniref:Fur family transcriptional regulator n=1 Tax=Microbacterium jiangjiandongii TaxID=3049071 RepID=UPI00214AA277|nr:Fur family transcriptional regulator [Microbacterium sp. zg.Y843]MCR2814840.1 transcriptional repressor [Microbacterium sp. zg.Y843]